MLLLAPWRWAPLLLMRRPGVALALGMAALVATLPAAAGPVFLSSSRNAALHHQIAAACPWAAGLQTEGWVETDSTDVERSGERLARRAAERASRMTAWRPSGLSEPMLTHWFRSDSGSPDKPAGPVNVLNRTDFAAHVQVREGGAGPGVWLPHWYARATGLHVGDTLSVYTSVRDVSGTGTVSPVVGMRVAAVYTDLRESRADRYWCAARHRYEGEPGQQGPDKPIPALLLADRDTLFAAAATLDGGLVQSVDFTLADPTPTRPQAATVVADMERFTRRLAGDPLTSRTRTSSGLGRFASRSDLVRDSLLSSVLPITAAGVVVGLLVVGTASVFWVLRRRHEVTVLAAHGVPAAALGLKALAEALPALGAGSLAGWAAALALVRRAGPSPVLDADAVPRAVAAAAATFAVIVVVVAVVAAARCRWLTDVVRPHRLRLVALPWELTLVAAGAVLWVRLDDEREQASEAFGAVARLPAKLLVVPILLIVGTAALGCRLGTHWLRLRSARPRPARSASRLPAAFLASRRLGREAVIAAALAAAAAVPIALAAYGGTVNGSMRATLLAEARLFVGADVVLTLTERAAMPPALAGRATEVLRVNSAVVGGVQTDLLVVDPATFGRAAFPADWPGGRSLAELATLLSDGGAVAANPVPGGAQPLTYRGEELARVDVTPAGDLPAEQGGYPTMLIARNRLDLERHGTWQLWVRGDAADVVRAATAAGLPLTHVQTAEELWANTVFEPVTYTFAHLAALSLLTGLITLVGLQLYLESRAPVHRRGFALMRRMGMRAATHRWALTIELTAPLLAGLAGGLAIAGGVVALLAPGFEVNPNMPPGTVLTLPVPAVLGTVAAVATIAVLAVAYAQRRVGRATPGDVLRDVDV